VPSFKTSLKKTQNKPTITLFFEFIEYLIVRICG